ncbi:hypothetical protein MYCTH_2315372 [Thermothelomyces thermophilus ATCC 42464]|uniref:Acyl-coenzyme A diphosphatase SCS3 n=1 Tax=Thermothelomyces thermophilus (strain ATCC 42464 / BCRC 31852 / DSM 1799) TaxID=573729 RepID=G2QCT9_THET4|nr:uncharacterized protein MYCTH_2315372 [Thermothelomyces thermophilus ATCC 42464]AEO58210.1 hypothetical protein MYCTH_2315372 [Thermothelomyces thermophilus ATCC 42464]
MADTDRPARRYKSPSELSREPDGAPFPPSSPSSPSSPTSPTRHTARITCTTHTHTPPQRTSPYLPTPTERAVLALYPAVLVFGALFSQLSPETRAAPYDTARQAHVQDPALAPSYFARKDNLLNVLFVKRGWAWISVAFWAFLLTHPAAGPGAKTRARAAVRWAAVTAWWVFVTQWFFGPALIDRGFRWSGGKCEVAEEVVRQGEAGTKEVVTAAACKASGGSWRGGHDISGHVFLLVLGSFFLMQEAGWVVARWARWLGEERSVVMHDGAVKGALVEADNRRDRQEEVVVLTALEALGRGGTLVAVVVGLCGWMLLMTAIYFHTWFEKLTGLLVALIGLYVTYILPRWVPALRGVVGLPGI